MKPAATARRSANYHPSIWDDDFVQSLKGNCKGETWTGRLEKLKEDVKRSLEEVAQPLDQLELIHRIQRLGLGYHFDKDIKEMLKAISTGGNDLGSMGDDLHTMALSFRLLRQHGFEVSQGVFSRFMDDSGSFKASLCNDPKGMLSLYEASYLAVQGETILDEAQAFTFSHLQDLKGKLDPTLERLVEHALDLPLHWRTQRIEARWYIDTSEKMEETNPAILQLAKLEFNMVQSMLLEEAQRVSRWWSNLGIHKKLSFSRERLMESYLFSQGMIIETQFGYGREEITKVIQLITTIDDCYDLYGSLDELVAFTEVVERWDLSSLDKLPEYMRICFLALYNTVNETAFEILKEQGLNVVPYFKKVWADLCNGYLVEAKWYYSKYKPTLDEYLDNAWITIGSNVVLVYIYFLQRETVTEAALYSLENYTDLIRWSAKIFRICDDIGTSKDELERGDVPKSIQCYMQKAGVSESVAREHMSVLIREMWKKMNEELLRPGPFSQRYINAAMDNIRTAHCVYQHGDRFGVPDSETKDQIMSLLIQPLTI